jgi:hypothetical protein
MARATNGYLPTARWSTVRIGNKDAAVFHGRVRLGFAARRPVRSFQRVFTESKTEHWCLPDYGGVA